MTSARNVVNPRVMRVFWFVQPKVTLRVRGKINAQAQWENQSQKEFVMKRMWQNWLVIVALVTLVGSANAQNGWNQPAEIGSYQSILARAGYGNSAPAMAAQQRVPVQQVAVPQSAMVQSGSAVPCASNNCPTTAPHNMGWSVAGIPQTSGQIMATPVSAQVAATQATAAEAANEAAQAAAAATETAAAAAASAANAPAVGQGVEMGEGIVSSTPMASSVMCGDLLGSSTATCGASACSDGCSGAGCKSSIFQRVVNPGILPAKGRATNSNYTVGVMGMFFARDYEDNRFLAANPSGGTLSTNDADEGTIEGYGLSLGSRNSCGSGYEVVYWALNPGRAFGTLTGANVATSVQGFDQLLHVSSGRDLYDIYSNTVAQTVIRDTDINNFEFNFLRNGGTFKTRRDRQAFYELLAGFRWFDFDESLQYGAFVDTAAYPGTPSDLFYNLEANNQLLGFQLGARNEYCFGPNVRLFTGVKGGIFNNHINTVQNLSDINDELAQVNGGPGTGRPFSYNDEKNDVAFLGELDFGILYQVSCNARIRLGYRVLGVSGVALAADQMPYLYSDPNELLRANSNGSLMLHGGYYGLEFCF